MKDDTFQNYILDLGHLLKEKARAAKLDKDSSNDTNDSSYKIGYLMAFHEIISLMKEQAIAFGINENDIGLADIDPESDLL